MQEHYLHGILLPSGAFISELPDGSPATNTEELVGRASGHPDPLFRGIRGQKPEIPFTTPAVAQILDAITGGTNNFCLDLSAGNTDVGYKQGTNLGVRHDAGSSYHERLRVARGFLTWNTISAQQEQDATIACRLLAVYDGTNQPIVQLGTGSLSGTPTAIQWYTLGPVVINTISQDGLQEWSLESGVQINQKGDKGTIWPTYTGVRTTEPVLTLKAEGKPWGGLGLAGTVITSLSFYLRKKAADGFNVADGASSHIKITATNGLVLPEDASGVDDSAVSTLRIGLRAASSGSDIITINTSAAIT